MVVNNTIKYIFFIIFLLMCGKTFCQDSPIYTIKGNIIDKNSQNPIASSWVSILDLKNSQIINKVQSGIDGSFEINFKKGEYSISISLETYETLLLPINYSNFKERIYILPSVKLEPKSTVIDEVVIIAKDFKIENDRGKKIYHIGNKLKDAAGSMSNLLSYIPSVFVDIDGKVQLRGREPIIMINGRKSNLSKSDALQMLPSEMVKKIEIISNPTAKEGETEPIINIVTDKKGRGLIGGINLSLAAPTTLKGGLHLALNKEKFNGYALYGIKREDGIKNYSNEFLEKKNMSYKETESSNNRTYATNHFGEMQYEYIPDKSSELVGSMSIYSGDNKTQYYGKRKIEENSIMNNEISQTSDNSVRNFSLSNEIEYQKKLKDEKDLFKAEFEYEYEEKEKTEKFTENSSNLSQEYSSNSYDKYRGDELKLKMRYDMTLRNDAYFTVGYRLDGSIINQNQQFEASNINIGLLENDIKYSQYSHTGFVDYSNYFKGFYYNLGLSLKNTNRLLKDNILMLNSKRDFLNLLPNVTLSYEFDKNHEISFKYFSYLSQPRLSYLNSFNTSTDLQRISIGNPNLEPQKTHSFELAYMKEFKGSTITSTAYTNFTNDLIQVITNLEENTNIIISKPENIGKARTYGLDLSYSLTSPKWLNTIIKLNGQYGILSNNEIESSKFYSLNTAFINIVRLGTYNLELSWFFNTPKKINYQIKEDSNQYFKVGLSKRILKNNGNLVFSIIDPFNTGRRIQRINGSDYSYVNEFNPNQRRISLSLFLRFSSKSKFRATEKEVKEKGILQQ